MVAIDLFFLYMFSWKKQTMSQYYLNAKLKRQVEVEATKDDAKVHVDQLRQLGAPLQPSPSSQLWRQPLTYLFRLFPKELSWVRGFVVAKSRKGWAGVRFRSRSASLLRTFYSRPSLWVQRYKAIFATMLLQIFRARKPVELWRLPL